MLVEDFCKISKQEIEHSLAIISPVNKPSRFIEFIGRDQKMVKTNCEFYNLSNDTIYCQMPALANRWFFERLAFGLFEMIFPFTRLVDYFYSLHLGSGSCTVIWLIRNSTVFVRN